eukprot:CAMPEP_0201595678 /NCGR_PEP_ID=MMETSP0190_2-20130828/192603_1 /ASSEMBLY_ACC=CAM_ASM_000263 /TAXON_ID=37353 /ORGANISM="Rosalina sp." /LENGTH=417 /DNA_ID=CAMNT_0048055749 /DNA_START=1808 /DNA_END=3058 /DNA_ORIENTATION=-
MIWIIGEYAERIVDAGDRLEHFIDSFEEEGAMVQLQLLTSTVKLFLKKPDKAKGLVQKVLKLATEASDNPDLRDRGYVYWRLLSTDPTAARKVVLAERPVISSETFSLPPDYLTSLLENLSSLSSVYHRPPDEFVRGSRKVVFMPYEEQEDADSDGDSSDSSDEDSEDENESSEEESSEEDNKKKRKTKGKPQKQEAPKRKAQPQPTQQAPKQPPQQQPDLLGDLLGMGPSNPAPQPTAGGGNGGGGLDDLFGGAFGGGSGGGAAQQQQQQYNGPPLNTAFDSNKGQGLEMNIGFQRKGTKPTMIVQCANRGNDTVTRIDIKFNKNYLGIQPTQTVPLNGNVGPGQTQTVDLTLQLSQEPTPKNPLDLTVQMAARSMRVNAAKPPVTMFAVQIPVEIFFDNTHNATLTERNAFLGEW